MSVEGKGDGESGEYFGDFCFRQKDELVTSFNDDELDLLKQFKSKFLTEFVSEGFPLALFAPATHLPLMAAAYNLILSETHRINGNILADHSNSAMGTFPRPFTQINGAPTCAHYLSTALPRLQLLPTVDTSSSSGTSTPAHHNGDQAHQQQQQQLQQQPTATAATNSHLCSSHRCKGKRART
ncbi:hypothetical protein BDR26DRAFT_943310 [Obelidium mucronatum]|nr:hypothetical protein BDR26DRAFT_943310 [Obelidium mucronatum]